MVRNSDGKRQPRENGPSGKFRPRAEWMRDRSILNGRHGVGRLLWRGPSPGGGDDFLLKLGGRGPGRSRVVRNTTPAQAFRELCEMHAELRAGTKPKVADSFTFARLSTEYFEGRMREALRRGRRPSPRWVAQEQQHVALYVLPAFGSTPLARVDFQFAEDLVDRLESTPGSKGDLLSRKTIREVLRIVTSMLRWAKLREKVARLPFELADLTGLLTNEVDVHARKTARSLRGWDDEEHAQFRRMRDLDLQIDRIASLACLNGPRPAELCLVTRSDVDMEKRTLRIDEAANNLRLRICAALRDNPICMLSGRHSCRRVVGRT